ncbi:fluoride efflux transporter FluC [Amnibacterium endophyticum]|uniref:Fluoride-specific ion channel FluC n=1 Tax=Amnibacterium endophyticum TaxID=2109337 RepID=A0ABW4LEA0_9MICO
MTSPELDPLPLDSDAVGGRGLSPLHLRPAAIGLVAAGGALGTAAREGLALGVPDVGRLPLAVLVANVAGAFVLGLLLDALARLGPDEGGRRRVRLLVGTGFCGGFTTYSALATSTAVLLGDGAAGTGLLYAAATLLLGAAASAAGIACGALAGRRA